MVKQTDPLEKKHHDGNGWMTIQIYHPPSIGSDFLFFFLRNLGVPLEKNQLKLQLVTTMFFVFKRNLQMISHLKSFQNIQLPGTLAMILAAKKDCRKPLSNVASLQIPPRKIVCFHFF